METTPAASRFAVTSRRVVLDDGVRPATVLVEEERIAAILAAGVAPSGVPLLDFGELAVSPGLVDIHVHINEPGRADWEGFATATRAAAAGGVTTLVDMPLNSSPVTTDLPALKAKRRAAAGQCWVDVGLYAGVVPNNDSQLMPLAAAGVLGFKAFLCDSGLAEFPAVTPDQLRAAGPILAATGRPLLVHAELARTPLPQPRDRRSNADYLASRPAQWEVDAIELLIGLSRDYGCRVHIVHLANGQALPLLAEARRAGLPISIETCPHYLHFAAEEISDGDTRFKCAPPIRDALHRDLLWDGLRQGIIDTVGSDHSPCPAELKCLESGDFTAAWGGIASLQLLLSVVWTDAARRGFGLHEISRWLATNPARLLGLDARKGRLAPGCDADLVVWDPETCWNVRGESLEHRHKLTPYEGTELRGRALRTYLRGKLVFRAGELVSGQPRGELISRQLPSAAALAPTGSQAIAPRLNRLDEAALSAALEKCCGSRSWVAAMMAARPYADDADLLEKAANCWWGLPRDEWLQALAAHPRIGDLDSLAARHADTAHWAGGEQAGVAAASEATRSRLAQANAEYESRFGHLFVVCATALPADEILRMLEARLDNPPQEELLIAAGEQLKITWLRLRKLPA